MKTRFAPSPTGIMHVGTLRTAYINYLAARANSGVFLLRIDDTDEARNNQEHLEYIYTVLKHYGIDYDYTFKQSEHLELYRNVLAKLLSLKLATKTSEGTVVLDEQIIFRSNNTPTYHFASIVDDYFEDITLIIRGSDHINNLQRQLDIWKALEKVFGEKQIEVQHIGLLCDSKGAKLSKRDSNASIEAYKDYNPEAVLNWILRMGWSHPEPEFDSKYPIITKTQAIELFNQGHLKLPNSKINLEKLAWLNKKHNTSPTINRKS